MLRLLSVLALFACCWGMQSVLDTLTAAGQTKLVSLLQEAIDQNIIDLGSGGPYTILAPTNAAFAKMEPGELDQILGDGNLLSAVLKFHVFQGETFSWDLYNGRVVNTISGHAIRVYNFDESIYVNNGHIVKKDLEANNAVIHLIDEVLDVPEGSIIDVVNSTAYPLSTFASYLLKSSVVADLNSSNPTNKYTVFAPSNDAFSRLSNLVLGHISGSSYYLNELVKYHIHVGTLHVRSLDRNTTISTMNSGHRITVTAGSDIHLNGIVGLEETDIDCDNGVIHIIDHVLIPSSLGGVIG